LRKALWIPALIVLFFIGDRVGAWVLQQLVEKSQFRYARLYQGSAEADILSSDAWWAGNISHLYRYNGEVFQRTVNYIGKTDENWLIDRVISSSMKEKADSEPVVELNTTPYLLTTLNQLIQIAEQHHIEVELLVNPYYPPYAKRMTSLQQFIHKIESHTKKKVKNYALSLQATEGFGDYQHLNKKGSKQYLAQLLKDGVLR